MVRLFLAKAEMAEMIMDREVHLFGRRKRKKLTAAVILAVLFILTACWQMMRQVMYPLKYRELVKKYSEMYDLDPYLVLSVIKTESGFRHTAVSRKNAMGLMQITRGTGEWSAEKIGLQDFTADMLF